METTNAYKGGRCFNGAHRDAGKIIHIIPGKPANGFWGTKALCGAKPGQRGFGWSETKSEANCEACKKKLAYALANEKLDQKDFVVKTKCKGHVWVPLIPEPKHMPSHQRTDYALDLLLQYKYLRDMLFCVTCGCSGHFIKSGRGGIRTHYSQGTYFLDQAKILAKKYGFELPIVKKL